MGSVNTEGSHWWDKKWKNRRNKLGKHGENAHNAGIGSQKSCNCGLKAGLDKEDEERR